MVGLVNYMYTENLASKLDFLMTWYVWSRHKIYYTFHPIRILISSQCILELFAHIYICIICASKVAPANDFCISWHGIMDIFRLNLTLLPLLCTTICHVYGRSCCPFWYWLWQRLLSCHVWWVVISLFQGYCYDVKSDGTVVALMWWQLGTTTLMSLCDRGMVNICFLSCWWL